MFCVGTLHLREKMPGTNVVSFRSLGRTRQSGIVLASLRNFVHLLQLLTVLFLPGASTAFAVNVLTQHNDNFRTGANLNESILTVSNVSTSQFGKLFSLALDG